MSTPTLSTEKRPARLSRRACLIIIAVTAPLLVWLEFGKPTLTHDPVLAPMLSMTLTRLLGSVVFFSLLLCEGYRIMNPLQRPFWRSVLFTLPALAVAVNNAPILGLLWGEATIVHTAPVYWTFFALQCLFIGLFEEAAFRGVILLLFAEKRWHTRAGLFWSIMLTSAIFGLVHLFNLALGAGIGGVLQQIGYSFLIGAMCSVVLFKTRNIWLCVLLHAVFDFGGKMIGDLGAGKIWNVPTIVITAVLAVLTTVYLVWQFFRLDLNEVGKIFPSSEKHGAPPYTP